MKIAVVIPARFGSTRFPGKPLAKVAGVSMLERTYRIAKAATGVSEVCVATDDLRVKAHAESFGARALMNAPNLQSGSDRAAAANETLGADAVINLQGDAILTPPWVLDALVSALENGASFATPAMCLNDAQLAAFIDAKKTTPSSGTTVVVDKDHGALYFSKHVLPFARHPQRGLVRRHIGVYAYTAAVLRAYAALPQSALELSEGLEQLRALEAGMPITVVDVDYRGRTHWSVDHLEDVALAEALIAKEGELV
jgi:3-deoxy-manno-octulosonate cytidylyltransferase (CMP-KDO synthetase)